MIIVQPTPKHHEHRNGLTKVLADDLDSVQVSSLVEFLTAMSVGQFVLHGKSVEVTGLSSMRSGSYSISSSMSTIISLLRRECRDQYLVKPIKIPQSQSGRCQDQKEFNSFM